MLLLQQFERQGVIVQQIEDFEFDADADADVDVVVVVVE